MTESKLNPGPGAPARGTSAPGAGADGPPEGARRRRGPPRRIEVRRVQPLSPSMCRITFGGDALTGFATPQPAAYIKLVFPEPGESEPPPFDPTGPRPKSVRTYTPRRVDADALELDVDFVLHGEGPAGRWAAQAAPGQALLMMGPGPGYTLPDDVHGYLLIGDESALPAIETLLDALPASAHATVVIEVADMREERALASAAETRIHWVHRRADPDRTPGEPGEPGASMIAALASLDVPPASSHVYIACEAADMRAIRQWAIAEWSLPRAQTVGRGYWKRGASDHPDHDYGNDG